MGRVMNYPDYRSGLKQGFMPKIFRLDIWARVIDCPLTSLAKAMPGENLTRINKMLCCVKDQFILDKGLYTDVPMFY